MCQTGKPMILVVTTLSHFLVTTNHCSIYSSFRLPFKPIFFFRQQMGSGSSSQSRSQGQQPQNAYLLNNQQQQQQQQALNVVSAADYIYDPFGHLHLVLCVEYHDENSITNSGLTYCAFPTSQGACVQSNIYNFNPPTDRCKFDFLIFCMLSTYHVNLFISNAISYL